MGISTLHIENSNECIQNFNEPDIKDVNFASSTSFFQELEWLESDSKDSFLTEKCFIISGFRVPEEDSFQYFTKNWRDLCGLGNMLMELQKKYFVNYVRFLANNSFVLNAAQFHFMIILEVYFRPSDLIYLLDFVQKLR